MTKKEFFRAVNAASQQDVGYIAGDSAISAWLLRQRLSRARSFSAQQVAECYSAIKSRREAEAARPRTWVFDPGAGDGFGLWTTV